MTLTNFYFNDIFCCSPHPGFHKKSQVWKGKRRQPMRGLTMAMQIFLDGQLVTVIRDDAEKTYIVIWADGTQEKIPFGQKDKSD